MRVINIAAMVASGGAASGSVVSGVTDLVDTGVETGSQLAADGAELAATGAEAGGDSADVAASAAEDLSTAMEEGAGMTDKSSRMVRWLSLGVALMVAAGAVGPSVGASGAPDDEEPASADDALLWLLMRRSVVFPDAPEAPAVATASTMGLTVTWTAPDDASGIVGYDLQYRVDGAVEFLDWPHLGTTTTTTITGLAEDTAYQVWVRSRTELVAGDWSEPGLGTTDVVRPEFADGASTRREIEENADPGTAVGAPVTATETTEYYLGGPDAGAFVIDPASGQLRTRAGVAYDHERRVEYGLLVTAAGHWGHTTDISVTVAVLDVDEPPSAPAAPEVTALSSTRLSVSWTAPANTGPEITDYDVQYRRVGGELVNSDHVGDATATRITGLRRGTRYQVEVRATNAEGTGPWSPPGSGRTAGSSGGGGGTPPPASNAAPVFVGPTSFEVSENTSFVGTARASDPDSYDSITGYGIVALHDAASFTVSSTGQVSFRTPPDFENPLDGASSEPPSAAGDNHHLVVVEATGGTGSRARSARRTLDITVSDTLLEAPAAPVLVTTGSTSLAVYWAAPYNTGPQIEDYDVRYRSRAEAGYHDAEYDGLGFAMTLDDLVPTAEYDVQLRAVNADGPSRWSALGRVRIENRAPEFAEAAPTRELAENTAADVSIGAPVMATDADHDPLVYALQGAHALSFAIDSASGQIRTREGVSYDYEGLHTHVATVSAEDRYGGRASAGLVIEVTDVRESPSAPPRPVVTSVAREHVTVEWTAPHNTGPAIADYGLRYVATASGAMTVLGRLGAATRATVRDLAPSTAYEIQVQASSPEGTSDWSEPVAARTTDNRPPTFAASTVTRAVAENTAADVSIGAPVSATDADGDALTYALGGQDAGSLAIDPANGQIRTREGVSYDYEGLHTHVATVSVEDPYGGRASAGLVIEVTDVRESPSAPPMPVVTSLARERVTVEWTAPHNTGPAIADYGLRYVATAAGAVTVVGRLGAATRATVRDLAPSTAYEIQVQASSPEGTSDWSEPVAARTTDNRPPTFAASTVTRAVAENTAADVSIGAPVSATDADGDALTYALGGQDAGSLAIDPTNGQLSTRSGADYDHEVQGSYSVTVTAEDVYGGTATVFVTVQVTDVREPPSAPPRPVVTSVAREHVTVEWTAPHNTGPAIADYGLRYVATASGAVTVLGRLGAATRATVRDLAPSTAYEIQVQASSPEGTSDWSEPVAARTTDNRPPTFAASTVTRAVAENTAADVSIGAPVMATDADHDPLVYALQGAHALSFAIDSASGQIRTREGISYDYEGLHTYEATVSVEDRYGGRASAGLVIEVTDVRESPSAPPRPVVTSLARERVTVEWTAPHNTGPAIADYGLRYVATAAGAVTVVGRLGAATRATVRDLAPSTAYEIQVQASSPEGTSDWSEPVAARTTDNRPPTFAASTVTRAVPENTAADVSIGAPVSATDADGDALTYALGGQDAGSLAIDPTNGQLSTRSGADYDHEVQGSYSVTVTAEDVYGGTATVFRHRPGDRCDQRAAGGGRGLGPDRGRGWNGIPGREAFTGRPGRNDLHVDVPVLARRQRADTRGFKRSDAVLRGRCRGYVRRAGRGSRLRLDQRDRHRSRHGGAVDTGGRAAPGLTCW